MPWDADAGSGGGRTADGPARSCSGNLVAVHPAAQIAVDSRYNLAPSVDVFSTAQGRDMGSIARDVRRVVDDIRPHLPRGMTVAVLGQVQDHEILVRGSSASAS